MTLNNGKKQWNRARRKSILPKISAWREREYGTHAKKRSKDVKISQRVWNDVLLKLILIYPGDQLTIVNVCRPSSIANQSIPLSIYRQLCLSLLLRSQESISCALPLSAARQSHCPADDGLRLCAQLLCVDMNKLSATSIFAATPGNNYYCTGWLTTSDERWATRQWQRPKSIRSHHDASKHNFVGTSPQEPRSRHPTDASNRAQAQ